MKIPTTRQRNALLWLFFFLPPATALSIPLDYGLRFRAYSVAPELRTGLDLSPDGFLAFPDGFSLHFDVKFTFKEAHTYGYIFRVTDKAGNMIDCVLGNKNVSFSSTLGDIVFVKTFGEIGLRPDEWLAVRLDVNLASAELGITIGALSQRWALPDVTGLGAVRIVFGKNNYPDTQAVDVPDMTVRDLGIDTRNAPYYFWPLARFSPDGVRDELRQHFARCENPEWVLTGNARWKKESTFTCAANPYIAYNPDRNVLAVSDRRHFYEFSLDTKQLHTQVLKKPLTYPLYANQLLYNPSDSAYYAYNLVKEGDGRELAPFHPATGAWDVTTPHTHYSDFWHHNRYLSPRLRKLYLFGGYGHHQYRRDVFVYDTSSRLWTQRSLTGDRMEPRYLSGLGVVKDPLLLRFGGYGSPSGYQELSPRHYYDAYLINIENMTASHLWTLDTPPENFVVSNSLVVDTLNNCFYGLCFPFTKFNTTVVLHRFSLSEPAYAPVADTIPLGFKDTSSFVDLFMDKQNQKLIAVASSSVAQDSLASISIFTLSYPPMQEADLFQPLPAPENRHRRIILFLLALGLAGAGAYLYLSRRKKAPAATSGDNPLGEAPAAAGIAPLQPLRKQSIAFFGGFQVIDKDGGDITTHFKPLVKNLFLLVLLSTIKTGKGISFRKLKEILWFDMTEESANNNRGVAMSKIRKIMQHVGDIRFHKQGVYWLLDLGEDIYCDYYEALVLLRKMKESPVLDRDDLCRLLSIVSQGELLPNMQIEWADTFKSAFSNDFVDLIVPLISREADHLPSSLCIDMANAIFIHDPLNEDALRLKCSVLVKMGKNGLAKNTYTTFAKEYQAWFASEYKFTFDQVIGSMPLGGE